MGNLNDLLATSGDQTSTTDDCAGAKPDIHPSISDLATFQRARMEKVSPNSGDDDTLLPGEVEKVPDKISVAYAPKKRFLKDYQTEGLISDASKSPTSPEKVSCNIISKHEINNSTIAVKPSLETLNISSCIGVIVESELTKYEMCKENAENSRLHEKSVLPLLFTPYSDQTFDNLDEKCNQRDQPMPNLSKEKYHVKNFRKNAESSINHAKHDVEIISCSIETLSQQRHDKSKLSETEKSWSSSKLKELTSYETSNKSHSPKSYRVSPMNAPHGLMTHFPQSSQYLDEWRNFSASEKGYSYQNLPHGMKQHYTDLKLSKDAKFQFKTPGDPNYRRLDVQFSPKISRHQSPGEMSSSDNLPGTIYSRDDIQGFARGIDPRFYQNLSGEKYAQHPAQSSPLMRTIIDETPIDLRVKKKEKPSGYGGMVSYDSVEGKRLKFHGYDQPIKTSGQYYYLPAETEKGHHGTLPYNPAFLKIGEAETLKTYLSDQYHHSSRHSELAPPKPKQARSDVYPYRENYAAPKISEDNLNKSQMLQKWDRIVRSSDQMRSVSRRHQEAFEHDLSGSHYLKYFEANHDRKSSSPRLIPQLLPISPTNHSRGNQPLGYSPSHDAQSYQCKLCNSMHSSYRSFKMHVAKDHNLEPHPEHCSVAEVKASTSFSQDRAFTSHKTRQEGEVFHSVPKQIAEVYPIISKVPPTFTSQTAISGIDHLDPKNKILEKNKNDVKAFSNRDGFDDLKQSFSWDCRHQLVIDSEMNCTTCMEGFQDITDWRAHVSSMHMVRSCACRTCNKWFANAEELNKHIQGVHHEHRQVDVEYRCLYCRKAFTDEEVLYIHTREHERTLSISRSEGKLPIKGEMEIQKAVPDTTCPESDHKAMSDVASTISPTSDYDQDKLPKAEEIKSLENWKDLTEGDPEKIPSKKSFFLKKFQLEEMNMFTDPPETSKSKFVHLDPNKSNEKTSPHPQPRIVTARSIIDSLVTEGLTRNTDFCGFSKIPLHSNRSRLQDGGKSNENKSSQDVRDHSPEFLLANSSSEHPQKQPLLKDMLLQINSKSHLTFDTETKMNSNQPRTKCVRDFCDEIITHSFRESSPVGPTERLKIFDSIAFDIVPTKVESPPSSKNNKGAAISSSRISTDSNADNKAYHDNHQPLVDSTEKANNSLQSNVTSDSRKASESPKVVKQSTPPLSDVPKAPSEDDSDADSTCKTTTQKDRRSSPMQSNLGKRSHPPEDCQDSNTEDSVVPSSHKNKDIVEDEEPPSKKMDLKH